MESRRVFFVAQMKSISGRNKVRGGEHQPVTMEYPHPARKTPWKANETQ